MLNRLTALAPLLLTQHGVILIVHSGLCGVDQTLDQGRAGSLQAPMVARYTDRFGPVMRGRGAFWNGLG